ncbi:MAG: stage II sporulation protein M [Candidatus Woesearchaeota archaeon]
MVLESLLNPLRAERQPWVLVFLGFLYASLALFLSIWIFEEQASIVMVFLTVMAALPLMYQTLRVEEEKDVIFSQEKTLLREHSKAILFFLALFLGFVIGYTICYVILPSSLSEHIFSTQTHTISNLNQQVTGNAMLQVGLMNKIFLNNVKVLIFCILFSFIYGCGAIFILSWNASVIGAAVGNFIRNHVSQAADAVGLTKVSTYFHASSLSILRYAIHGIPEITAYFIAGLAGGILSVAIIRHDFGTANFEKILLDTSDLILISIFVLFVAALLEVFVTPAFFA